MSTIRCPRPRHVASQLRAERNMRNRQCNALTLDLAMLSTAVSETPAGAGNQGESGWSSLGNDDVGETARGVIGDGNQELGPGSWLAGTRFDSTRQTRVKSKGIDWIFEDWRCWTDSGGDTLSDVTTAPSTPATASEGWTETATMSPPSPWQVEPSSSVPTTPESSPPGRPLWDDSFQKFSFQKGPLRPVIGPWRANPDGEGASAPAGRRAVDNSASSAEGIGPAASAHDAYLYKSATARSWRPEAEISAQAPEPSRTTTTTPAHEIKTHQARTQQRGKFLAEAVTVIPVTARATCITRSTPPTPTEPSGPTTGGPPQPKHEQRDPTSPSAMQQRPPEFQPAGAVTPAGDQPHEPSITQQLRDALENSIAPGSSHYEDPASHHAEHAGRWPPLSQGVARSPDDEGPFNFSRPAAARGPPRSTTSSPISTPRPDVLTPGKASAPTSPTTAAHLLASTPVLPPPRMQNPLYHGSAYPREPLARARATESTTSFRSHCTESTAPATCATERSSVTRGTSVQSVESVDDEEPIVDEVMRMYEKGFYDDTDEEEEEEERQHARAPLTVDTRRWKEPLTIDTRPPTAASGYSLPATTHPLTANPVVQSAPASPLFSHPPLSSVPPSLSLSSPAQTPSTETADSPFFDPRSAFSPIPEDLPPVAWPRRGSENRDSGKSMGDCETHSSPEATLPHAPTSITNQNHEQSALEEDLDSRDRYGFKKANQYVTREAYDAWNATYTPYLDRRRWKWVAFMKENNLSTDHPNRFPPPGAKTKRFVRKGIPPEWRGAAWFYYAGGPAILGRHAGLYDRLVKKSPKPSDADIIERDLHRTFPDNDAFRPPGTSTATGSEGGPEPSMISALRRVLHAFSIHNPKIGYCQSLNFIAGLLLLFVPTEEQAFWLLNIVTQTLLPGTHETNLEGSKVDLGVLMTALRSNMPELWEKLAGDEEADSPRPGTAKAHRHRHRRRDVTPITKDRLPPITITMAAWFMSCFIGTLPTEPTLRVWDVFFYEGSKTLFRTALAILKVGESQIAAVEDPMEMFAVVQGIPRGMLDANLLLETCFRRRGGFGGLGQGVVDDGRREMRGGEEKRGLFRRRRRDADVV